MGSVIIIINGCKNKEKSKKNIIRGQKNVRYHDTTLSIKISRLSSVQKAYGISRKGSHPHPTPTSQQILPQNHKNTNHRV